MSAPLLYETDDVTLATTYAFPSTAAGSQSAAKTYHVWFNKGTPGGMVRAVSIAIEAEITSGVWAEKGCPLLDRQEIQARISGSSNPLNDPAFPSLSTGGYKPIGSGAWLALGDIAGNCSVFVDLRVVPSVIAGSGTIVQNFRLRLVYGTQAEGRVDETGVVGIKTGYGDPSWSEWLKAPTVLATGTPDAVVHIGSSRSYVAYGIGRTEADDTITGNQNDSAAAALTSGQGYWLLLSQPLAGGVTVGTKGLKATIAAAVLPVVPASSLFIGSVLVRYQAGGVSLIANTDIFVGATDGQGGLRYSGASLIVTVGRVRALLPGVFVNQGSTTDLTLTASVTSTIYLSNLGTFSTTAASDSLPFWSVTCNGTGVTSVVDLRTYVPSGQNPNTSTAIAANGAIAAGQGSYFITKGSALGSSAVATPIATMHDGWIMRFVSTTAFAHVVSFASGKINGGALTTATFGGAIGDAFSIIAYQGVWYTHGAPRNVTIT